MPPKRDPYFIALLAEYRALKKREARAERLSAVSSATLVPVALVDLGLLLLDSSLDGRWQVVAAAITVAAFVIAGGLVLRTRYYSALLLLAAHSLVDHLAAVLVAGHGFPPTGARVVWHGLSLLVPPFAVYAWPHLARRSWFPPPPPLPPPCTLFDNAVYLGDAVAPPGDGKAADLPHVEPPPPTPIVLPADRRSGFILATGTSGTGKTAGVVEPVLAQAIRQHPAPPPLPRDDHGAYLPAPVYGSDAHHRARRRLQLLEMLVPRLTWLPLDIEGALLRERERLRRRLDPVVIAAYGGNATEGAAERRRAALLDAHRRLRPAILVVNSKRGGPGADLADLAERLASADSPARYESVSRIAPSFGTSMPHFDPNELSAETVSVIMTAIDAKLGRNKAYFRGRLSNLLTAYITARQHLDPGRLGWRQLTADLGSFDTFSIHVHQLQQRIRQLPCDDASAGLRGTLAIALATLETYKAEGSRRFREVTSFLLSFSPFVNDSSLRATFAPEVPTLSSYDRVLRDGRIVILDLPVDRFSSTAKAHFLLQLEPFMAAIDRVALASRDEELRPVYIFVDDAHLVLTDTLVERIGRWAHRRVTLVIASHTPELEQNAGWRIESDTHDVMNDAATRRQSAFSMATNAIALVAFGIRDGVQASRMSSHFGTVAHEQIEFELREEYRGQRGLGDTPALREYRHKKVRVRRPLISEEELMTLPPGSGAARWLGVRDTGMQRGRLRTRLLFDIPWLADGIDTAPPPRLAPVPEVDLANPHVTPSELDRLVFLIAPSRDVARPVIWLHRFTDDAGNATGFLVFSTELALTASAPLQAGDKIRTIVRSAVSGLRSCGQLAELGPRETDMLGRHSNVVVAHSATELQLLATLLDGWPARTTWFDPELGGDAALPRSIDTWRAFSWHERSRRIRVALDRFSTLYVKPCADVS